MKKIHVLKVELIETKSLLAKEKDKFAATVNDSQSLVSLQCENEKLCRENDILQSNVE